MSKKAEVLQKVTNGAMIVGSSALIAAGVLAPSAANAQTGGTAAPDSAPASTPSGGTEVPTGPTNQALDAQAQQAKTAVARNFLNLSNGHNTSSTLLPAIGGEMLSTTVTVPVEASKGHSSGKYQFNILSEEGLGGQPDLSNIVSVSASEIAKSSRPDQPPVASVRIGENPGTDTAELGGTYQVGPPKGGASSSSDKYISIGADVEAISPTAPVADSGDISGAEIQLDGLAASAQHQDPIHKLAPAFTTQGK